MIESLLTVLGNIMFDSYARYVALLIILLGSGAFMKAMDDPCQSRAAISFKFTPNPAALVYVQSVRTPHSLRQNEPMPLDLSEFFRLWQVYKQKDLPQISWHDSFFRKIINNQSFMQAMLTLEEDPERNQKLCQTLFFAAAAADAVGVLQFFIDNGYDINQRDPISRNALFAAIEHRRLNSIRFLIQQGADLKVQYHGMHQALDLAHGRPEIVRVINEALRETLADEYRARVRGMVEVPSSRRLALQVMLDQRRRDQGRDQAEDFVPWQLS